MKNYSIRFNMEALERGRTLIFTAFTDLSHLYRLLQFYHFSTMSICCRFSRCKCITFSSLQMSMILYIRTF